MSSLTLSDLALHPLPTAARLVRQIASTVTLWSQRHRSRLALKNVDAHMLRDIGLDPASAAIEATKPFWRA
jgi:uncharacterized protein YjiS (DUF1127 family)